MAAAADEAAKKPGAVSRPGAIPELQFPGSASQNDSSRANARAEIELALRRTKEIR
jgi:hypothetical protein